MTITVQTDYAGILAAVLSWFETYSGLGADKVLWLNQATPRLARPFGTLYMISDGGGFGLDEERDIYNGASGLVERTTLSMRRMTIQADVYSDPATAPGQLEAMQILNKALTAGQCQPALDGFRTAGITLLDHSPARPLDVRLGQRWERRAEADLFFLYPSAVFDDAVGWIETVDAPTEGNGQATYSL